MRKVYDGRWKATNKLVISEPGIKPGVIFEVTSVHGPAQSVVVEIDTAVEAAVDLLSEYAPEKLSGR